MVRARWPHKGPSRPCSMGLATWARWRIRRCKQVHFYPGQAGRIPPFSRDALMWITGQMLAIQKQRICGTEALGSSEPADGSPLFVGGRLNSEVRAPICSWSRAATAADDGALLFAAPPEVPAALALGFASPGQVAQGVARWPGFVRPSDSTSGIPCWAGLCRGAAARVCWHRGDVCPHLRFAARRRPDRPYRGLSRPDPHLGPSSRSWRPIRFAIKLVTVRIAFVRTPDTCPGSVLPAEQVFLTLSPELRLHLRKPTDGLLEQFALQATRSDQARRA